jgi:hypothetical protein
MCFRMLLDFFDFLRVPSMLPHPPSQPRADWCKAHDDLGAPKDLVSQPLGGKHNDQKL